MRTLRISPILFALAVRVVLHCEAQSTNVYSIAIHSGGVSYLELCSFDLPFPPHSYKLTQESWYEYADGLTIIDAGHERERGGALQHALEVECSSESFTFPLDFNRVRGEGFWLHVPVPKNSGDLVQVVMQCATNRGARLPTNALPAIQTSWIRQSRDSQDILVAHGDHYAEVQKLLELAYGAPDSSIRSSSPRGNGRSLVYTPKQIGVVLILAGDSRQTIVSVVGKRAASTNAAQRSSDAQLQAPPAVIRSDVAGETFVADFYRRADLTNRTGILLLGGSEGGKPRQPFADRLAEAGYPVLAVAYFKEKGLPESLQMIPLEYFDKPIKWMQQHRLAGRGGIVVVGGSRGAELALLLASAKAAIKGVIAISPSSVVWNGMPKEPPMAVCSSWSLRGKTVSFMPADLSRDTDKEFSEGGLPVVYKFFQGELAKRELVSKAAIQVERIHGPILLASGHDDEIWPAEQMGDAICSRLREKRFKYKFTHLKYPDAGHTLSETLMIGGTVEGNRKARIDLTGKMLAFLKECDSQ